MKEQIEEMARGICGLNTSDGCFCDGGYCNYNCLAYEKAEALYNAGYRKQSEGEWETETTNQVYDVKRTYCSNCRKSAIFDSFMGKYHLTNFCPNCGAKMKGGAE